MSFSPEVYVGRIPIYYNNFMLPVTLDYILDKTILYEDSERPDLARPGAAPDELLWIKPRMAPIWPRR